jgi:hypothetical protein
MAGARPYNGLTIHDKISAKALVRSSLARLICSGLRRTFHRSKTMRKITLITASLVLAVSSAAAFATPKSKGASAFSPGSQMRDQTTATTTKGASDFAPGDQMKDLGTKTTKGASDLSPGDQMNDARRKK